MSPILGMDGPLRPGQNARIFDLCTSIRGDETTVFIDGELDLAAARVLEQELAREPVSGARRVVVDLERVDFIDMSGLRPIISLALAERPGACVAITPGSHPVQRLLELSGLTGRLDVVRPGRRG